MRRHTAPVMRRRSRPRRLRERIAMLNARANDTSTLSTPISAMPATASQKAAVCITPAPSTPTAVATAPVDSVTWRTSMCGPKNDRISGPSPSMKPSETLATTPDRLRFQKSAMRCAPRAPTMKRRRR